MNSFDAKENKEKQDKKVQKLPEEHKLAIDNYEKFFKLRAGSATLDQVKATTAGIEGFANWKPTEGIDNHGDYHKVFMG